MATKKIDFEKIEKQFFPQQVELWEKNFNGDREAALLYLWFFNNVLSCCYDFYTKDVISHHKF